MSGGPADATVEIISHEAEEVVIRVRNDVEGFLRLADPYHAGWIATVDGEATPVFAADHYLRAVHLDPGEHEVVFSFRGPSVLWPQRISMLALVIIGGLWIAHMRGATANMVRPSVATDAT